MDRAEAIEILAQTDVFDEEAQEAFDMAIAALREQEQSQWISVKERLPLCDVERVLVHIKNANNIIRYPDMDTDRFCNGRWVRWGENVTHWMPLPEPPKEGADHA